MDTTQYEHFLTKYKAPVFCQPWYLDAVSLGGKWSYVDYQWDDETIAVWPYFIKSKYGQQYITMPPLVPYLGPFYHRPTALHKNASWYSLEKKILQGLFEQLPSCRLIHAQCPPEIQNWLPLHWLSWQQTTRYTYRIDLTQSEEKIWSGLSSSQKNWIRKAATRYECANEIDNTDAWDLIQATYVRQGLKAPFSKKLLNNLLDAARINNALHQVVTRHQGQPQAIATLVSDATTAYLLLTARQEHQESGAVSLAIWQSIQWARRHGLEIFDFEGSMIPGIEAFFRSFGGELTPYHRISHIPGKVSEMVLRLLNKL